jgi:RNA polymerase sigma factor (sigma-70 family)
MTGAWLTLRQLLAEKYDDLRSRLTRRLGSEELASEVLHETWLRLDQGIDAKSIRSPGAYLFRSALNIAIDRGRAERRRVQPSKIEAMLYIADDAPGPAQQAEARLELEQLERALEELTPRRRTILLAARLEGLPLWQIAERLDISQRLVEIELKHALEHCAQRLNRNVTRRFGPRPRQTS